MTYTVKTHNEAGAVVKKIAAEAGDLPVYYGTGYAIEKPHVLSVTRYFEVRVTVYPTGEHYLGTDHATHYITVDPNS